MAGRRGIGDLVSSRTHSGAAREFACSIAASGAWSSKPKQSTGNAAQAAGLLASRNPTSLVAALLLGGGAIVLAGNLIVPNARVAWVDHQVRREGHGRAGQRASAAGADRRRLGAGFAPSRESWTRMRCASGAATAFFDEVSFRPANGRLRLGLGSSIPELFGRSILLAPAVGSVSANSMDVHPRQIFRQVPAEVKCRSR